MTFTRKTITASLAALTLGASVFAFSSEASARPMHRHGGFGWGGVAAVGIGALALGAIAANSAYASDCAIVRRPIVDRWGNVVGYNRVRVCD